MNRLSQLALSDEGFVFDPQTGDSFQVSETGIAVLRALKEGRSDEEICKRRSKSAAGGARKVRHLPGRRERFLGWEVKSGKLAAR